MKMNGMNNITGDKTLASLYNKQIEFQKLITKEKILPDDKIEWFSYHIQGMVEEMGEIMKADKRWKVYRSNVYNKDEKLEEIADVFITLMNIAIFSGFNNEELFNAINNKIKINIERYKERQNKQTK